MNVRTRNWYLAGKPTLLSSIGHWPNSYQGVGFDSLMRKSYETLRFRNFIGDSRTRSESSINTDIHFDFTSGEFVVRLHDNTILEGRFFHSEAEGRAFAELNDVQAEFDHIWVNNGGRASPDTGPVLLFPTRANLCGYPTPTTLTRLRQLNINIFKRKGKVYLVNTLCEVPTEGWFNLVIPAPATPNQHDLFLEPQTDEPPF